MSGRRLKGHGFPAAHAGVRVPAADGRAADERTFDRARHRCALRPPRLLVACARARRATRRRVARSRGGKGGGSACRGRGPRIFWRRTSCCATATPASQTACLTVARPRRLQLRPTSGRRSPTPSSPSALSTRASWSCATPRTITTTRRCEHRGRRERPRPGTVEAHPFAHAAPRRLPRLPRPPPDAATPLVSSQPAPARTPPARRRRRSTRG